MREKKSPPPLTPFCTAVIAAAGSSRRMGEDKLLYPLGGLPVLARTLMVFEQSRRIDEIVVVTREEKIIEIGDLCRVYGLKKVTKVVAGGATRLDSVLKGVEMASDKAKLIAVHDGARPFVTEELIHTCVAEAERWGACVPFVPLADTVKERNSNFVRRTLDRSSLVAAQTPQVFKREVLYAALRTAEKQGLPVTDDASAVEAMGSMVHLTEGSPENIKLTTPLDLMLAEAILRKREGT